MLGIDIRISLIVAFTFAVVVVLVIVAFVVLVVVALASVVIPFQLDLAFYLLHRHCA